MTERRVLIVCGVARSGTTALARVLNAHPLVCIGLERYKFQWYRGRAFGPRLFDKNRFFHFQPGDTNVRPEAHPSYATLYAAMEAKWDVACVVGDKIPHAFLRMEEFDAAYKCARYLYIFRHIDGVAASWKARAQNELDQGWLRSDGCQKAVVAWNDGNKLMLERLSRYCTRIQVIDYDRFFSGEGTELTRLCSFLELETNSSLSDAFVGSALDHQTIISKRLDLLDAEEREFIRQNAVMENYWCLMAYSVDGPIW